MLHPPRRSVLHTATFGLLLAALIALWQWQSGCYDADLASDPDEPAHAVSSLLVRDYVAQGLPEAPLPFAESYYVHYPKIAIGHWPPFFYTCEAAWMLVFGRSKPVMLLLVAAIAIALLLCVFGWVRRRCGAIAGLFSAALLVLPAFMRADMDSVKPDILLGLLAFLAAAAYGSYLEFGGRKYAAAFWGLAILSLLTHGRGAEVWLLPVAVAIIGWRLRPGLVSTVISAAMLVTSVILPYRLSQAAPLSLESAARNLWTFPWRLFTSMGWPVAALAAIGAASIIHERQNRSAWTAMIGLAGGCWLFFILVNVPLEARYLIVAAPGVAALFGAGIVFVNNFVAARWHFQRAGAVLGVLALCLAAPSMGLGERKPDQGFHRIVNREGAAGISTTIYLIAGDSENEGAFIADMDLADTRQQHVVLRASKMLADVSWMGLNYKVVFDDSKAVAVWLDEAHVGAVIVQNSDNRPHIAQLREALENSGSTWVLADSAGVPPDISVYRRAGPMPPGPPKVRVDMRRITGRFFYLRNAASAAPAATSH